MKTLTLRLSDDVHRQIVLEARARRISVSEVIREACDQVPLVGPDQPDREAVTYALHFASRQLEKQAKSVPQSRAGALWEMWDRLQAVERRMGRK